MESLADAVVKELNDGDFSQSFTAARAYIPEASLADLATLRVTVVPKSASVQPLTRDVDSWQYEIDVGVQQRVDTSATDGTDALVVLVQEFIDKMRRTRLADYPVARWVSITNDPIYDPKQLREQKVFTSVITVAYAVNR